VSVILLAYLLDEFVQFASVEPYSTATGTIVNLDPLPLGHQEIKILTVWTLHKNSFPGFQLSLRLFQTVNQRTNSLACHARPIGPGSGAVYLAANGMNRSLCRLVNDGIPRIAPLLHHDQRKSLNVDN
jgi:hypothetical protein